MQTECCSVQRVIPGEDWELLGDNLMVIEPLTENLGVF